MPILPDTLEPTEALMQVANIARLHKDLYGDTDAELWESLMKEISPGATMSDLSRAPGEKEHPFEFITTINLKNHNPHHSTCIETKTNSICGLGHESIEGATLKTLDGLCETSWTDWISDITEDYVQVGNAFAEVVRDGGKVVAIYHVPAPTCRVMIIGEYNETIYKVIPEDGAEKLYRKFGVPENAYVENLDDHRLGGEDEVSKTGFESEIIHFKKPTSTSLYYGVPNWLGAVPSIELAQCLHQYNFDFFLNRGVPEFLMIFTGALIPPADWTKIEAILKQNVGTGNSHKSQILNIPGLDKDSIQLHKLAMESKVDDAFSKISETLSLEIVSAHQVPPLLAGIQIPGKMGAANELPNALMAFQLLVIQKDQNVITGTLDCTLGDEPSFPIARGGFKFKTILGEIAEAQQQLNPVDTMSRMREPVTGAKRDLNDGLKE